MSNEYELGQAIQCLSRSAEKIASDTELSYGLKGKLHLSNSGWLLLTVPNALGRGAFDALNEVGVELPVNDPDTRYNAHISVVRPEELKDASIDPNSITERGHEFSYTLGPVRSCNPAGWDGVSTCWFISVRSPELEALRKSYGLTAKQNGNKYDFHITFAIKRTKVTQNSDISKRFTKLESVTHNPTFEDKYVRKAAAAKDWLRNAAKKQQDLIPSGLLTENMTVDTKVAEKSAALGKLNNTIYGKALTTTPITFDSSKGVLGNIKGHLSNVKNTGDRWVNEAHSYERLQNAMDPNRALRELQKQLAGVKKPIVNHPVDRIIRGEQTPGDFLSLLGVN